MIKNKRLFILTGSFVIALFIFKSFKGDDKINKWQTIFNGKNLDGWNVKIHHHEYNDNYKNTFRVKDKKLVVDYSDYEKFNKRFGHIFYEKPFSSFHLKFETKFTQQFLEDVPSYAYLNSGVMFHSQDPKTILKEQDWPVSIEYQILAQKDNNSHRSTANVCSPSTDILVENQITKEHCVKSSSKSYKWNEWQKGELIVYSDSLIIHKVNGQEVLRYSKPQIGGKMKANGVDPKYNVSGTALKSGYIAFQAEG